MKYFKKMFGECCYLSPVNPEDVEKYVLWLNDMEVTQNLPLAHNIINKDMERETLEKMSRLEDHFAIVEGNSDELIGGCGLINLDQVNRVAEVDIFIGEKSYWNKGYGEEALRLLIDYGFNILNLHNILLKVYSFNARAIRCYHKVGFKEIGRRRQARQIQGKRYDIIYMDILAEELTGDCSLPPLGFGGYTGN